MDTNNSYKLGEKIISNIYDIDNVISVSIVGSFSEAYDINKVSDLDTIVILKELNKNDFDKCINAVSKINLEDYDILKTLKINTLFGPLKFNDKDSFVVHLMIYGVKEHKEHVIKSPFTCLDWERSNFYIGSSLKNIFPTGVLQLRDFTESRRSIFSYIDDITSYSIEVREYDFKKNNVNIVKKCFNLDQRHIGEFSYHIFKNLVCNYLKLLNQNNNLFYEQDIINFIKTYPQTKISHLERYSLVSKIKSKTINNSYPAWTLDWIKEFVHDFMDNISNDWSMSKKVTFIRHAKTHFNDNTFLGQNRDPEIINNGQLISIPKNYKIIYTSPLLRAKQTASFYNDSLDIIEDKRLCEINYGSVEGLKINDVKSKYPEFFIELENGFDPRFPEGGENTSDVLKRLNNFITDLCNSEPLDSLIVSHNVILRSLIGNYFLIPRNKWFKINIPHLMPLEFLYRDGKLYPNIERKQLAVIFKNF